MAQSGQGVQVVKYSQELHNFTLDEGTLGQILLREDVKNLPVVVVSVAGGYRGGKSFLLNFFLRYLTASEQSRNDDGSWLGKGDEPLTGFSWRGGSERHTTGIMMWSEPYIATLLSGDKVAVLLMDTQGIFDSSSTVRDCSTIFALSMLTSSVQIYNIKENIKEDDLQNLQLFTEYGRQLKNKDGGKGFQVLEFLIRDWPYEYELAYGREGGEQLLAKRLEVTEDMPTEQRELRQHIHACFESVTCFLMPHPGRSVRKKNYQGNISELDEEFKTAVKQLVHSIFASANLTPKLINGEKVKARDLFSYFKTYVGLFQSETIPSPVSIAKATADAALLTAMHDARELYDTRMEHVVAPAQLSVPQNALEYEHRNALAAAQTAFTDKKKMASKNDSDASLARLTQELEELLPQYLLINQSKTQLAMSEAQEAYDKYIRSVHGDALLCLNPADLPSIHDNAVAEAYSVFSAKRKEYTNIPDVDHVQLVEDLQKRLENLRVLNDQNNRMMLSEVKMEFFTDVEDLLTRDPPLSNYQFYNKYQEVKEKAINAFDRKRNLHQSNNGDIYTSDLAQTIRDRYYIVRNIIQSTRE